MANVAKSLLDGNRDDSLIQARSELMKQDNQVDLSIIVSVSFSDNLMLKD